MPTVADYIIKLSISLAIVFLFYRFVLSNLTFYKWNRWYLLAYTILCFFIPFVDIMPAMPQTNEGSNTIINMIPALEPHIQIIAPSLATEASGWSLKIILFVIIAIVSAVLLLRLIIQFISLRLTINKARLISNDKVKLYYVDKDIMPFSFGNSIFINPQLHNADELQEIIRHEFVHVKQKHSIDVLWAEVLCIINWFNPFVWLIRNAVRQNLEFIADNKVLQNGTDKTQYQYLLLKVLGNHQFAVASPFNFSSLKKRISMMNKMRTAKIHLLKFLFIAPILTVLLLAFRSGEENNNHMNIVDEKTFSPGEGEIKGNNLPVIQTISNENKLNPKNVFTIAGIVIDNETLEPVEGVIIGDNISGAQTTSDEKGYYHFDVPIKRKDSLRVIFNYKKNGYPSNKENGGIIITTPEKKNNAVVLFGITKGKTGTGIFGNGPAQKNGKIVYPDYENVYITYANFIAEKKTNAEIGSSSKPIQIKDGIPFAIGNASVAWFSKEEAVLSSEYKVWADGKILTIDEANSRFNRFELKGVAAVPRTEAKKIFGLGCNVLVLMKDSLNPIPPRSIQEDTVENEFLTAYFITPSLVLDKKTNELRAVGPFSGKFIGGGIHGTLVANSESGYIFKLGITDTVKFNGVLMQFEKSYPASPNEQFMITFAKSENNKSRIINIGSIPSSDN